ncbi:xanthine dehydrogenase molybdopterin binding subunit [Paraliomyxa miuraensis]|uniref:xanthine dehydrogenase molybdopterin binding subunit n=1 Tax=Paraliomyxa miuraensis TaxID=376150 RepID=UPI0022566A81|nr:xanthine dehydrogenase molybdopterin binding subunit [Paraliomyxa miuraensis]MCX4244753.1 xanthine dehydrogenase molybdopterin binding subunit [Paraliomyxa miuraensis]
MKNQAPPPSPLHQPAIHESGYRHVSGQARYVDDWPLPPGTGHVWVVTSPHARARIVGCELAAARAMPGVRAVLLARDVPGSLHIGPIVHDEELLARDEVLYVGQPVALVVADDLAAARMAGAEVRVEYEVRPAILTIEQAIEAGSYVAEPHVIARGDVEAALAGAALRIDGEVRTGAQDHFYLETQAALAIPGEGRTMTVLSSSQHPTEVQAEVAAVLGVGRNEIVCEVPRMGGGFGGKESQATPFACMAALAAHVTGRPAKVWLNRERDMRITGKRHPFLGRYDAGLDADGRLVALSVELWSDAGFSADLSLPVLDRALFHLDNAYYVPALRLCGRACVTNLPSNTAFRGFGGPQGMVVIEEILNRAAERMGIDPAVLRERNYYGEPPRDRAPYGQEIPWAHNRLPRIHARLMESSGYASRREAIAAHNAASPWQRRGIGFQPVKFGISFTKSVLNQAGAFVLVYTDGTVQLNHGGTEMGQGLHTKMLTVCAHELGVPVSAVRVMTTATDKVPNTSATAASSGSDLNGQAVRHACGILRERLRAVAARMLELSEDQAAALRFEGGAVVHPGSARSLAFPDVAQQAWLDRVSLSATGYYHTPGVGYDHATGQGTPFYYYAYGGVVCEVEVNGLTGEHRMLRVDILHDVGSSLVPTIDRGQVEGGFVQGVGWLTCEEVLVTADGHPVTLGPSTYKIPAVGDVPVDLRVELLPQAEQPGVVHGSKAVGEPPFMLALGVVTALRHAIGSFGPGEVELALPATPEAILRAVQRQRGPSTT